ncbi:YbhB/YbcL family Raf kinase inhibitor-like protein [Natrinema halophilum]|uniref:YbhB/YbcL family Raf kinase inhibitor-like protein n=1 Tax=Natrinema halophilum TaxID=1699371 RepID=A0A7D5GJT1_9EURY|nr:YbhB/YbcL family Raf kinase inhibitor-like protein [Natrinema halophilum]QLG48072.1 YbhB/YbcL family Raf kinase inhibitor-like protein [Natrinema halophilum]
MGSTTLESPAFDDGERIPEEYGYAEDNTNPPLEIDAVPDDAESLALIVDDPDAREPAGKVWDHWVLWNVPPETGTIPEGWDPIEAREGMNDFGERGYGGPNPPDREHTYRFRLFALDTTVELESDADANDLESAIDGHVLEQAKLEGTYPA